MYKKEQHVLIITQHLNPTKNAINHAQKLAKIFKSKILISHSPFSKNGISQEELENDTFNEHEIKTIKLNLIEQEPNQSIEKLNIIFMLVEIDEQKDFNFFLKKNIFNWILKAKIPTILIGEKTSSKADYSNIFIPIDHKKESKEKMIWASYFGRFNSATIHLFPAKEKNEVLMKTIRTTLLFTKKMYSQFKLDYQILNSECKSKCIDEKAFKDSKGLNSDLIILMTGKSQGVFFMSFNSKKIKLFMKNYTNPILLINPLKDYYLPCER